MFQEEKPKESEAPKKPRPSLAALAAATKAKPKDDTVPVYTEKYTGTGSEPEKKPTHYHGEPASTLPGAKVWDTITGSWEEPKKLTPLKPKKGA